MILRRMADFAAKRNWTAVAVELLIVIVGVFLGLQAQEWNQQRIDRNEEAAYVSRLAADFAAIEEDLARCLSVGRSSLDALDLVSRAVDTRAAANDAAISEALVRMTASAPPAGRSAAFIEMLSSDELGLLRDADLRDALVAYDADSQANREIWRTIRGTVSAYGRPLYENIVLSVDPDARPMSSIEAYDLEAMSNDPGFRAMLNVRAAAKSNLYELCGNQLRSAGRVTESLAKQRDD